MPIDRKLTLEFVADSLSLKKVRAVDVAERRAALDYCLSVVWAGADISELERIEDDAMNTFGWALLRRS